MPIYRLRYTFDCGSGICLWSANENARSRFGYAVSLTELNLPTDLICQGHDLIARYDSFFDWDDPVAPTTKGQAERAAFQVAAAAFLSLLRQALGANFLIFDGVEIP